MGMEVDLTDADLVFEAEVRRAPYVVATWQRYIEHKQQSGGTARTVFVLYERALQRVPGSYKLWSQYLRQRVAQTDADVARVSTCFERALLLLHRMPRLWLMYAAFVARRQADVTVVRGVFDRALRALPVTQHGRVWRLYLRFARAAGGVTCERVYARWARMWPERGGEAAAAVEHAGRWAAAGRWLLRGLGAAGAEEWRRAVRLAGENDALFGARTEAVLHEATRRLPGQGEPWVALAAHLAAAGRAARARGVFEQGVAAAGDARAFALVFDAYAQFEQEAATAALAQAARAEGDKGGDAAAATAAAGMALLRLERLVARRALLASDVVLRQRPDDVDAWLRRVLQLCEPGEMREREFARATQVLAQARVGERVAEVWAAWAGQREAPEDARVVWARAVAAPVGPAAGERLFVEWALQELAWGSIDGARRVLTQGTARGAAAHRSARAWALLADVEEGSGAWEAADAAYEQMLRLKLATPATVANHAAMLEARGRVEASFRVFERGIAVFGWPVAADLWGVYLARASRHLGAQQLERLRDLHEQALVACPPAYARPLYLAYGRLEEQHGLARRALRVYERFASAAAPDADQRLDAWRFYAARATELLGAPAARAVYERGVGALPDQQAALLAVDFAAAERRLGEIDRARALFAYAAAMSDPRRLPSVWAAWREFEVQCGSEDTFREMLRVKRSAVARFGADAHGMAAEHAGKKAAAAAAFDASAKASAGGPVAAEAAANPDELAIDDDDL